MEALRELGAHLANCHCAFTLFVGALVAVAAGAIGRAGAQSLNIEIVTREAAPKPNLKN